MFHFRYGGTCALFHFLKKIVVVIQFENTKKEVQECSENTFWTSFFVISLGL